MRRKYLIAIAATAILAASPVLAADMELKAPPIPVAPSWTGFYVGLNGGGGWDQNSWTFPTAQFFTAAANQGFVTNPSGGVAGGQIGYNFQIGQWVLGVEFAGDWSGISQRLVGPVTPAFPLDTYTTRIQDYETLTARVGYAPAWPGYGPGNWLWYAKAGGATGGVNFNGASGAPVSGVTFSDTQRLIGVTAGAGVEFMWASHFVLGVEYDYIALSRDPVNTTATCTTPAICGAGFTTPVTANSGIFGISTVVGRLSYKF
jgi:outer membrane immunogenic protein